MMNDGLKSMLTAAFGILMGSALTYLAFEELTKSTFRKAEELGKVGVKINGLKARAAEILKEAETVRKSVEKQANESVRLDATLDSLRRSVVGLESADGTLQLQKVNELISALNGSDASARLLDLESRIGQPKPFYFHGAMSTPTRWIVDVIMNDDYSKFCSALAMNYTRHQVLQNHWHHGRGNGYFYEGWYYAGPRYCGDDVHVAGEADPTNPYSVWQYSGNCGCCIDLRNSAWTREASAIVWCESGAEREPTS